MKRELSATHDATIDVVRVLALSSVLVAHLYDEQRDFVYYTLLDGNRLFFPLWAFFSTGGGGVALFFMMSGYLVAHSLLNKSTNLFLKSRFFRIYPTYIVAIIACKSLTGNGPESISDWIGSLTLLGDFWRTPSQLGGVSWTLNLEVYFFVSVAVVSLILRRKNIRSAGSIQFCMMLLLPLLVLVVLPIFPMEALGSVSIYAPLFIPGIAIYFHEKKTIGIFHLLILSISAVFATFYNAFRLYEIQISYENSKFVSANQTHEGYAYAAYILGALAIFLLMFSQRGELGEIKLIRWFADHSYQLYLFHFWLIGWIVPRIEGKLMRAGVTNIAWNHFVSELAAFLCLAMTVAASRKYIEKPIIRLGKNLGR